MSNRIFAFKFFDYERGTMPADLYSVSRFYSDNIERYCWLQDNVHSKWQTVIEQKEFWSNPAERSKKLYVNQVFVEIEDDVEAIHYKLRWYKV